MEYRYIIRLFLSKRVYRRLKKRYPVIKTLIWLSVLVLVSYRPIGFNAILARFKREGRAIHVMLLAEIMQAFSDAGYVIRDDNKVYSITPLGKVVLADYERALRNARIDR